MNNISLLNGPILADVLIHRALSFFNIGGATNLRPQVLPKLVFVRTKRVTRWNE